MGTVTSTSSWPTSSVIDRSLRAHRGERIANGRLAALRRRVELFGFHIAKLDVRVHARDLQRPTAGARDAAGRRGAQRQHGPAALRHPDPVGHHAARDVLTALELAREAGLTLSVVPLFESIDDLQRAARSSRAASPSGVPRGARCPPPPDGGDGRLLGLGQGRRLPRGAVGDLPRPGGSRGGRAARTGSS